MIIVSQDKVQIINMDNTTRIFIQKLENEEYGIGADTNSAESHVWDLGYYKTEERAKEVLQQIAISYANIKMINIPNIKNGQWLTATELKRNIAYEMPER